MFKKNSWIVALILALSFTALFTGCIDAVVEEAGEYDSVELKEFNTWGGQAYQQGWATGGLSFSGIADKPTVAKDLGYDIESFMKARYLEIDMEDATHPKGNLDIIWGGDAEDGTSLGGWHQNGGITYKKDGSTIRIDLPAALKDYADYQKAAKVRIVLQAGGEPDKLAGLVKAARLLIPLEEAPFVEVTDISLVSLRAFKGVNFDLLPVVTPDKATTKSITWAILNDTLDDDGNIDTVNNSADADFALDNSTVIVPAPVKSKTKILPKETGVFVVRATIKAGKKGKNSEGKNIYVDFTKDFTVTVTDPQPIKYKVNGTEVKTKDYQALDNGGAGSWMEGQADGSFKVHYEGNNGNSYSYFKVDLGTDKFENYTGVKFKLLGKDEDSKSDFSGENASTTSMRVRVSPTMPAANQYAPGALIWLGGKSGNSNSGIGDITSAQQFDAHFGYDERSAADFTTAYGDISSVKGKSVFYIWIYFQPNLKAIDFTVSDIEFYKPELKMTVDGGAKTTTNYGGLDGNGHTSMTVARDGTSYDISYDNGYGNCYYYFEVDFGAGNIGDYTGVKFKYTGISGDTASKNLRVVANLTKPTTGYNPGLIISNQTGYATVDDGTEVDLKFGCINSASDTDCENAVNTVKVNNKIYVWILSWGDPAAYTISDINFYK